jgi:hypothetical protein
VANNAIKGRVWGRHPKPWTRYACIIPIGASVLLSFKEILEGLDIGC